MQLARIDSQTVAFTDIPPFLCDLLRSVVDSGAPGNHEAAQARIYSTPTHGADPDLDAEWQEFVEPDLRAQFESSRSQVERDLAGLTVPEDGSGASLRIPVAHLDSWISALNQARLVLTERHGLTEQDLDSALTLGDLRSFTRFQIGFYGELLFWFVREVQRRYEDEEVDEPAGESPDADEE